MSDSKYPPQWRRSSRCASGNCIEVAESADGFLIRDSKNPEHVLTFSVAEWDAFTNGVKAGDFA